MIPLQAVEVISQGNTREEMDRKLRDYFAAGVRSVWYVYPETSELQVYDGPTQVTVLTVGDALVGGDVLPGFRVELARVFAKPKKRNV